MKRKEFIKIMIAGVGIVQFPQLLTGAPKSGLPNILIIGDSVSLGYTPFVRKMLEGKANIYRASVDHNPICNEIGIDKGYTNCQGTMNGVEHIKRWLGDIEWDLIHFNFGLHDLKHVTPEDKSKNSKKESDPQQSTPKEYKANLKQIVIVLKETNATLIFANTTPFPDLPGGPFRRSSQVAIYNKIAGKIMKKYDIPVTNLNSFVSERREAMELPKNVHFSKKSSEMLAGEVVKMIRERL